MSAPPKTLLTASPEEEQGIREAVRNADIAKLGPFREMADLHHAPAVLDLFNDPAVSEPVYSLPRPFSIQSVSAWISESIQAHAMGEGLLVLSIDPTGQALGYSKITVWPDRASAELGGALRASLQNTGGGGAGAAHTINWMFSELRVRLICLTAALDNTRSIRLIDRMGFCRMGERDGLRPDGTTRKSHYWEMTRDDWLARTASNG